MKVLLIKPPLYVARRMLAFVSFPLPLGILQIAAVLERNGNEVQIVDCLIEKPTCYERINDEIFKIGLNWDRFQSIVKSSKPDLIGISNLFSSQADALFAACKKCKEVLPGTPLIVGGVHPTLAPLDCLKHPDIDFVGVGEGEFLMLNLVKYLKGELQKKDLLSIYFKENGQTKINGIYPKIENLDDLPLPAYHLVDFSKYFFAARYDSTVRGGSHQRWVSIITSRGCPFSCNFCNVKVLEGRKWRFRSPTHTVGELEYLYNNYGIRSFSFDDSDFTFRLERAEEIMDLLIKKKLSISFMFPNGIRADSLTKSLIKKMKKAGCEEITLAFEHGHEGFLNTVIKKGLNLRKALEAVTEISHIGIPMTGFFIFGMPGENREIHEKNIVFIYRVAKMGVIPNISLAMPLPKTELQQTAMEEGYLDKLPSSRDYLTASNSKTLFKNLALPVESYNTLINKVFLKALFFVILFHPELFFRHPFVKSLAASFTSLRTLRIKARKIISLILS